MPTIFAGGRNVPTPKAKTDASAGKNAALAERFWRVAYAAGIVLGLGLVALRFYLNWRAGR
jgi:hypothetical protein